MVDALLGLDRPCEVEFLRCEGRPIDEARNRLALDALRHGASHVLFYDSDMAAPPGSLGRLLGRRKPIVSGLAFGRAEPHLPIVLAEKENGKYIVAWNRTLDWIGRHDWLDMSFRGKLLPDEQGSMMSVQATGMAFTLIRADVLKRLEPGWADGGIPEWFRLNEDRVAGEDARFCERAALAGFDIWLDRSVIVGHGYGDRYIGPLDALKWAAFLENLPDEELERATALGVE